MQKYILATLTFMMFACTLGQRQAKPTESVSANMPAVTTVSAQPSTASQAKSRQGNVPTSTPSQNPATSVSISLGTPKQLMHDNEPDAFGIEAIPDQPLTPMLQPDKSYRLFFAGDVGENRGSTGLISTKDFLTYTPVAGTQTKAEPVLTPSCRGNAGSSCVNNFDAEYTGVDLVFPSVNGKGLVMIYQGTSINFGATPTGNINDNTFYSVVALATSTDNGLTWTRQGPIITGSDPKPSSNPRPGANGADQSGAIVANGYIYDFYSYFPSSSSAAPTIQVARAPVSGDGMPGTWTKFYNGSFGSQPGIGGLGSQVVPDTSACTRPAQPWLTFSTYLNEFVMTFICKQGWFFTTSTDLVNWNTPIQFYTAPFPLFTDGEEADENPSLVTPGNPGQVISQTGYVLYADSPAWNKGVHLLWMRPFSFTKNP